MIPRGSRAFLLGAWCLAGMTMAVAGFFLPRVGADLMIVSCARNHGVRAAFVRSLAQADPRPAGGDRQTHLNRRLVRFIAVLTVMPDLSIRPAAASKGRFFFEGTSPDSYRPFEEKPSLRI